MAIVSSRANLLALILTGVALPASAGELILVSGIPLDFILFGLTLLGVALLHNYTLYVGLTGLLTITLYKLIFSGFKGGDGLAGLGLHFQHEWVVLANLFCLLMGFALLSRHFGTDGIWWSMPAGWAAGFGAAYLYYRSGRWKKRVIIRKKAPA